MSKITVTPLKAFHERVEAAYNETLEQALKRCYGNASKSLYSQAKSAAIHVGLEHLERVSLAARRILVPVEQVLQTAVLAIKPIDVTNATARFYRDGLSPATINKRLNCLSKMGVSVEGLRVKDPKKLKWYLKESDKVSLLAGLRHGRHDHFWASVANFIEWTTLTGLRIEESLRLQWKDLDNLKQTMVVSGTKTATSQATLPFGSKVKELLVSHWALDPELHSAGDPVFNLTYSNLQEAWEAIRQQNGWKDDPTATLKALRRSAARYLHVDCNMPLHMVQQYLRHESMDTTLEYLRLTGGYGTEEMRRYLK